MDWMNRMLFDNSDGVCQIPPARLSTSLLSTSLNKYRNTHFTGTKSFLLGGHADSTTTTISDSNTSNGPLNDLKRCQRFLARNLKMKKPLISQGFPRFLIGCGDRI